MIALRVRALDLLRSELRALGVEHDELTQRLGSGQSAHLPSEPLYSARGEGAAGAPGEGGTARGEEGVKGGAALLSPPRPPLLRRGSSAEAATIAAIAAAAAADALEQSGTEGTQPGSEGTQPGSEGTQQSRLRRRRLYALALLAAVAALRVRETRQLCQVWASPEKLYTHLVAADPTDAPMLQALASLLIDSTDPANHERAESLLRQSLVAEPNSGAGYNQLGLLLKRAKRNADAEAAYAQAIEVAPREGPAYVNWGNLLLDHNNNNPLTKPLDSQDVLTRAAELLTTGVELLPNNAPALNSLAVALKGLGRLDEARAHYEEAISLRPDSASFQHNLALLFMQQGFDTRKPLPEAQSLRALAKQHFEAALALQPAHVGARQNLASLIARTRPPR
ncbi:hypothetical protein T492DRAFT_423891 [Pavlovales sp. CCMP2436]|nr:hypothetical protein T492DRAFT_423891 [Pavlovales sp. CCMP2436]